MASVRSEINKTLSSLTSRSFCSPKQQICVQGPPGMQDPKGTRGRRGPRGTAGRKGPRGDTGQPGPHGKQGKHRKPDCFDDRTRYEVKYWMDDFTIVALVTWPVNDSEAGVDLVLMQTSLLLLCESSCSYPN